MTRLLSLATALPAAAALFATTARADTNGSQVNGVLSFPVTAQHGAPLSLSKRQQSSEAVGRLSGTVYTINVKLGSPGQWVPAQFDTGSTELIVNPVCSKSHFPAFCSSQPRFTMSTSLVDLGVQGSSLVKGGYADFTYVADYIGIGSARLAQQIFGVTYNSDGMFLSVLGAAPSLTGWDNGYPLAIDSLATQGIIQSKTFSVDLKGLAAGGESVSARYIRSQTN